MQVGTERFGFAGQPFVILAAAVVSSRSTTTAYYDEASILSHSEEIMGRTKGATNKTEREHKKDAANSLLKAKVAKQKSEIKKLKKK